MLSPKLRKFIPQDSLDYFQSDYKNVMEDFFYNRESEETLIQNSRYNYQVHDRNRQEAEVKSHNLTVSLLIIAYVLLIIIVGVLIAYIRYKNKIIGLQSTINSLNKIAKSFNPTNCNLTYNTTEDNNCNNASHINQANHISVPKTNISEQSLKNEIRNILEDIKISSTSYQIPDSIMTSDAFAVIRKHISDWSIISSSEEYIWNDLEKIILDEFPYFLTRLQLLLGEVPDVTNLRIALLIKCGVTSAQAGRLFGRSKSTISYRRAILSTKILGDKSESNYLDKVIQAL